MASYVLLQGSRACPDLQKKSDRSDKSDGSDKIKLNCINTSSRNTL